MHLKHLKSKVHPDLYTALESMGLDELRPCQVKSLKKGLLDKKSLLVCTPTGSGKTLVAEIASVNSILNRWGKAVYIVPLKALAMEKYKNFTKRYGSLFRIGISIGDLDSSDPYLSEYDMIITTSEKLDSLIRHSAPWLKGIGVVVIDEIHLLNDPGRGPTLEILITILKKLLKDIQIIGLSATIGNPEELSAWLGAELVQDDWRPVELKKGIMSNNNIEFY